MKIYDIDIGRIAFPPPPYFIPQYCMPPTRRVLRISWLYWCVTIWFVRAGE